MVRVHGTRKALALTSDSTPRYCFADPVEGGKQAVAEAWRNLTAVGARPLALTDNMNFGNPERPEIMGQFVGCTQGMAEACRALDFPVVSGNVSLYNETNGQAILPTPVIGGVGILPDVGRQATLAFKARGEVIWLVGETRGHLGCSLYLREILKREDGAPPPVDLRAERRNGDFVRDQIVQGAVTAVHDLADGGLFVALAEMALAGSLGAEVAPPDGSSPIHAWLFGEDQGRYLVTTRNGNTFASAAKAAGVSVCVIGRTGGDGLTVRGERSISLRELRAAHEGWLPRFMTGGG